MLPTKAIKTFFELDGGRKVTIQEFKALTPEDKHELAVLCCEALGVQLIESQ